nr:MAG TPA: hypothetical protein [Caudoviricetes sp.]
MKRKHIRRLLLRDFSYYFNLYISLCFYDANIKL